MARVACFSNSVTVPTGTNPNVTYRVIVTNDGTSPLENVQITDAAVSGLDQTLLPLRSVTRQICFTDTANNLAGCLTNCANALPNTVHVTGTVPNNPASCVCGIGTNGEPVMATSQCSALLQCGGCAPGIQIIKQVTCLTSDGCPPAGDPAYGKNATGVVDSVFCYSITVLNIGDADLVNIVVTDTTPGGAVDSLVSACFPTSFSLAAGTSTNCIHTTSYTGVTGDVPDFVHVVGHDSANNTVSSSDNASVAPPSGPARLREACFKRRCQFCQEPRPGRAKYATERGLEIHRDQPNSFPLQNVVITESNALPSGTSCTTNGTAVTFR